MHKEFPSMAEFRVEKDSLGPVNVPADAYYGAQTQRAVDNFPISGLKPYPAFVWSMALIKRAAAEVHLDLGLLEAKSAEWDGIVKSGRTHLQDAVPIRLGQEVGAWAKAVERNIEKIRFAAEGVRRLGIGGTANGTGLNAHPEYHKRMVARLSQLSG